MDYLEAVSQLIQRGTGASRALAPTNVHEVVATAIAASSAGTVTVDFGGPSVTGDGSQSVEVPTTVDVRVGDVVRVSLVGADGTGKSPTVTGVVGGGDRTAGEIKANEERISSVEATNAELKEQAEEHASRIEAVQKDVSDYKTNAEATYATKTEVDDKTGAITKTLTADYLSKEDAATTYTEQTTFDEAVNQLKSTMSSNYSDFTDYKTSNDAAVSSLQDKATDTANDLSDYKTSNDAAVKSAQVAADAANGDIATIKTDYATKSELEATDSKLSASIGDSLTTAKGYTDSSITQEVTDRNAAIEAKADSITSTVSQTYTKQETFEAYQEDADSRISTASSNASTAMSTAKTAASDAATAKSDASAAKTTASVAKTTAETASSTASAAKSTAETAASDASSAVSTAESASTTASGAASKAEAASTAASTAQKTADGASTAASAAQKTADSASSAASAAQSTADGASSAASKAQSTADGAASAASTAQSAADAAQSTADGAASAASAAQEAADAAQDTADANKASIASLSTQVTQNASEIAAKATSSITLADGTETTLETLIKQHATEIATLIKSDAALNTLIRETSDGVEVGKSADGETYTTNRALVCSEGAFAIMDADGNELSRFDDDEASLLGGRASLKAESATFNGADQAAGILEAGYPLVRAKDGYAQMEAVSGAYHVRLGLTPHDIYINAKVNELRTNGLVVNGRELTFCERMTFHQAVTSSDGLDIDGFVLGSTFVDEVGLAVVSVRWTHGTFDVKAWGSTTLATFDGWRCDVDSNFPAEPYPNLYVLQGIGNGVVFRTRGDTTVDSWVGGSLVFPVKRT